MHLNCGVGEDSWESLGLQGYPTSPFLKEICPEYSLEGLMLKLKLQWNATWCEELTHWRRPWCWERLKAGGEGDDRGWDGWMTSPTQWTWVWVNSRVDDGQGSLAYCSPWDLKESDTTERLNWTEGFTVFALTASPCSGKPSESLFELCASVFPIFTMGQSHFTPTSGSTAPMKPNTPKMTLQILDKI